ncbi:hypothetical protein GCM10029978_079820 [Actinoallomurus acanthiterrae]
MTANPGLLTRVVAGFKKEVPANTIESIQKAGVAVYRALDEAEAVRRDLTAQGIDPWDAPVAAAAQQLYAWNAYVLQTLGDKMIEADYRADTRTVGYLPRVTAEQVWAFFGQVEGWLSLSRQAAANPDYRPDPAMTLPADLPGWIEIEPCPAPHLQAMIAAGEAVREHAEVALGTFEVACAHDGHRADLSRLRQIAAEASSAADYAAHVFEPGAGQELHEIIEQRLQHALGAYYHLGQLLAMPTLLTTYGRGVMGGGAVGDRLPPPGALGFDPWCLSDPGSLHRWTSDAQAIRSIDEMWRHDPDPAKTLRVQEQINAALYRGDIVRTGSMYYCSPWASIYRAQRSVVLGTRVLQPGQDFTYEVSAEEILSGGRFVREIVSGPFQPASRIEYDDPGDRH